MISRITSSFRGSHQLPQINLGHDVGPSPDFSRQLEDLRKLSLNSLLVFLGIHLIGGSKFLAPLTLSLLIYTISLHLAISASFLQNCPIISRSLHAVPFLGMSCMAIFELVVGVQSPVLILGGLLLGVMPTVIVAVYHARRRAELASPHLPVRMREVDPLTSSSTGTMAVSG